MAFEAFKIAKKNKIEKKSPTSALESNSANKEDNVIRLEKVFSDSVKRGNFELANRVYKNFASEEDRRGKLRDVISSAYTRSIVENDNESRKNLERNFSYYRSIDIDQEPKAVLKIMLNNLDKNGYVVEESKKFLEENAPELINDPRFEIKIKKKMIEAHQDGDLKTAEFLKETFLN